MRYELKLSARDMSELKDYLRAPEYAECLYEIAMQFRDKYKYYDTHKITWGDAYDLLWSILREHNFDPLSQG